MLAFLLIVAARTLPLRLACFAYHNEWEIVARIGYPAVYDLFFLAFSLLLIAHDPVGYGVRVGSIGTMWRRVLLFCGGPLIVTAIVCSQISTPFSGGPITGWLISPIAQNLLFAGYFYRHLSEHFPGLVHDRLPIAKAILITAGFFALWHVPNDSNRESSGRLFGFSCYTHLLARALWAWCVSGPGAFSMALWPTWLAMPSPTTHETRRN